MAARGSIDLERFQRHHPVDFDRALAEIQSGRKCTHWMWFIFPQIVSLGRSPTAIEYGITSREEADAYLRHPILGRDYTAIVEAVRQQVVSRAVGLTALMGRPDDFKLVSSVTLFRAIAQCSGDAQLEQFTDQCDDVIEQAELQGFPRCVATTDFLAAGMTGEF